MGERTERAYEAEIRKAFDALPWRVRWRARLPGLLLFILMLEFGAAFFAAPFFID